MEENVKDEDCHNDLCCINHATAAITCGSNDRKDFVTIRNIQYSRPLSKDLCSLAALTFEKMEDSHLKLLQKLNDDLREEGKVSLDALIPVTKKIIMDVWDSDKDLAPLLNSDKQLTQNLGKEMLVLFDNVISDPVYSMSVSGKPQRYTKACLDNSIQPIYDDHVPDKSLNTFETVISTYTSPTAFTPEMESLLRQAASLGIPVDNCNLKNFATERSLSAFLRKVIRAKIDKDEFMQNFNRKLLGVLRRVPSLTQDKAKNRFKYSFSKMYQLAQEKHNPDKLVYGNFNSPADNLQSTSKLIRNLERKKHPIYPRRDHNDIIKYSGSARFGCIRSKPLPRKFNTMYPQPIRLQHSYRNRQDSQQESFKSWSDSILSGTSYDSLTPCVNNSIHRRRSKKKSKFRLTSKPSFSQDLQSQVKYSLHNNQSEKLVKPSVKTPSDKIVEDPTKVTVLTAQRSFFKLGEGSYRDGFRDLVEPNNKNNKKKRIEKKVQWSDRIDIPETPSTPSNKSEFLLKDEDNAISKRDIVSSHPYFRILNPFKQLLAYKREIVFERTLWTAFNLGILHGTIIAFLIWIWFIIFFNTSEIGDRIKNIRIITELRDLFTDMVK